jgi:cell division protein FtsX
METRAHVNGGPGRRLSPALRRTAAIATRRPRAALWTLAQLSCALFLIGIAVTTATAVERWTSGQPGSGGAMVVYLGDSVDEARAMALVGELRGLPGVLRAELVSSTDSASRLSHALGADPALLDGVDLATLPASVEVTLAPGVRDVAALSPTVRALRGAPGVAEVVVEPAPGGDDAAGDARITAALSTARTLAWTGAALVSGLALVIMLAALRGRLARSPRETAVLELLGAPPGFTAIPLALAGALLSSVAAVFAALALALVSHGRLDSVSTIELGALVALGALVGLVGGCLAASR